jgi:hypothetical protein
MPRGGRRPGAGAPRGNLNAYKHGRSSRTRDRLLEIVARDPEALALLIKMAKEEKKRHERRVEQAKGGMKSLFTRIEELLWDKIAQAYEINRTVPPPPGTDPDSQ